VRGGTEIGARGIFQAISGFAHGIFRLARAEARCKWRVLFSIHWWV
jgi:hypothetical protein